MRGKIKSNVDHMKDQLIIQSELHILGYTNSYEEILIFN